MQEILLDRDPRLGRTAGLEDALRRAVRDGRLIAGTRLPSTRSLAAELGLARATVVSVYEQLTAEGYLLSRQGAGTVVAQLPTASGETPPDVHTAPPATSAALNLAFVPGEPDRSSFPQRQWLAALRRVLTAPDDSVLGYGDRHGSAQLQSVLGAHLARTRGIAIRGNVVSICGGTTLAFFHLGHMLVASGATRVAVENPGLPTLTNSLAAAGLEIVPISVIERGISIPALSAARADAVVVTPAHQYPLGVTMPPERRGELLAWAREGGGLVIEDDYDGEFRYDRQPVGALQGLAPDHVIYAGTASKALAPGLRLSWLVLPGRLEGAFASAKGRSATPSGLDQAALASLIDSGELDRHVRQQRLVYRERRDQLVRLLAAEAPWLQVVGISAGLHVTAVAPDETAERRLIASGAANGLALVGLGRHVIGADVLYHGLVLGYSRAPDHAFGGMLDQLRHALRAATPSVAGGAGRAR